MNTRTEPFHRLAPIRAVAAVEAGWRKHPQWKVAHYVRHGASESACQAQPNPYPHGQWDFDTVRAHKPCRACWTKTAHLEMGAP